jgi:hypothetical protein
MSDLIAHHIVRYEIRRQDLIQRINEGCVTVLVEPSADYDMKIQHKGYTCYFCGEKISQDLVVLEEMRLAKGPLEEIIRHFSHKQCYESILNPNKGY